MARPATFRHAAGRGVALALALFASQSRVEATAQALRAVEAGDIGRPKTPDELPSENVFCIGVAQTAITVATVLRENEPHFKLVIRPVTPEKAAAGRL